MEEAKNTYEMIEMYELAAQNNTLMSTTIELLTKCNWRCKHCYIPHHDSEGISEGTIFDIFTTLRKMGTFEIILTGGEIFYRKDIMDIIEKAREMFFEVILFTNLSLLDENKIKKLSELYISQISCTIFSLDPTVHDSITGVQGSLKKVLDNVTLIKKYGIPLEIKTMLMSMNYKSYTKLYEFCKENGFNYVASPNIFSKSNGDCTPLTLRLSQSQLEEVILDIDKISGFSILPRPDDVEVCPSIKTSLGIDCQGNVNPCNSLFIRVGNIYETPLEDIWNHSKDLYALKKITMSNLKECALCKIREYCVRCAGVALLEDGDLFGKSSLACMIANARYKKYNGK